ncbi:MAG: glycosyltransferase family 2 protein [bacterium]|nr:glycosyltransferase family 2 protein [bacterium]
MKTSVILPTLNAAGEIAELLAALKGQTNPPEEILVVDSGSTDGTAQLAREHGARVMAISRERFDHGGTRDMALRHTSGEFVLFLTQDALPADASYIDRLLKPFADERVAAASGRQLPRSDARPYVRAVQQYRYPSQSRTWGPEERKALGIRAYHLSDVCAAYRRSAYEAVGGFTHPLPTNEDMLIAAAFLDAGYRLAYCADAAVVHSHDLTFRQEYRRNVLIGRFLQEYGERLGNQAETGEGLRMARQVLTQLVRSGHSPECVFFAIDCAARALGSRVGRRAGQRRMRRAANG